jgi:hypothetical protein
MSVVSEGILAGGVVEEAEEEEEVGTEDREAGAE